MADFAPFSKKLFLFASIPLTKQSNGSFKRKAQA
jgi:hypothetical protein